MTKKHFIAAAAQVERMTRNPVYTPAECELVAKAFAELFQDFNPRFKRDQFLEACGLEKEAV